MIFLDIVAPSVVAQEVTIIWNKVFFLHLSVADILSLKLRVYLIRQTEPKTLLLI